MSDKILHRGSGNVYKDLGFPNAEEMQAKAALVSRIMSIVKKKKWTQEKASVVLGVPQPKISLLSRGQFSGFSLGKLITLLIDLEDPRVYNYALLDLAAQVCTKVRIPACSICPLQKYCSYNSVVSHVATPTINNNMK